MLHHCLQGSCWARSIGCYPTLLMVQTSRSLSAMVYSLERTRYWGAPKAWDRPTVGQVSFQSSTLTPSRPRLRDNCLATEAPMRLANRSKAVSLVVKSTTLLTPTISRAT